MIRMIESGTIRRRGNVEYGGYQWGVHSLSETAKLNFWLCEYWHYRYFNRKCPGNLRR